MDDRPSGVDDPVFDWLSHRRVPRNLSGWHLEQGFSKLPDGHEGVLPVLQGTCEEPHPASC